MKIYLQPQRENHDQVKLKLHDIILKYNNKVDINIREDNFEVGDFVLVHFRKKIFPKREKKKLN